MNIVILSDVVLAPTAKEFKKLASNLVIHDFFEEDLISCLLNYDTASIQPDDIFFIHSDQIFHKKAIEWQTSLMKAVAAFAKTTNNKILFSNAHSLSFTSYPLSGSAGSLSDNMKQYESAIHECLSRDNVFFFDFYSLSLAVGTENMYQYNLGHLYQMPYTKAFSAIFARKLFEYAEWLNREEKKVIVVDCDNTLWKGVVGENGIGGIKCDNNAEGILYYHFQQFLKAKKGEGFLLCICSKNNENDVKEVFDSKNWPLSWDDFVVRKINWNDKWVNINEIASDLNVNTDSFIFIDDNPFEINSVNEFVNGISSFEFKDDYVSFLELIKSFLFRKRRILADDLKKSSQYQIEALRKKEEDRHNNIDDFIKGLNIVKDIRINDSGDFERLAQMTGKTNQFNFNKKEYTADALATFINKGNLIYSLKVSDRFGDYGTVGLILVDLENDKVVLENFLMSCRALGKRIEDNFFDYVIADLSSRNFELTTIKFRETLKNKPAQNFLNKINHENKYNRASGNIQISVG